MLKVNMEKRISVKLNEYQEGFKSDIKKWLEGNDDIEYQSKSNLLKFIYDYDALTLDKEDFSKRKRVKSFVPHYLRCSAKRANGEQCTRRKKDDSCFCGTHDKNRPHGEIDSNKIEEAKLTKVFVWHQEINGILYYIDDSYNIYKTEDIIANKINPSIIAKYSKIDDVYKILE